MDQMEAISFAIDWREIGSHPGGKLYKKNFANAVYEAQTGYPPPNSKSSSKVTSREFKAFKSKHKLMIRGRSYLLDMYIKVRRRRSDFVLC